MNAHRGTPVADERLLPPQETPRHRAAKQQPQFVRERLEEEVYEAWCKNRGLDPYDTDSMVAYEGDVGWLYLDQPAEDHRL